MTSIAHPGSARLAARPVIRLLSLAALLTLAACGDAPPGELVAGSNGGGTTLSIQGGNNQSVAAGTVAQTALTVRVTDRAGVPVPGVTVTWSVTSGEGSVSPTTSATDANGVALATFTAGPSAGTSVVRASAGINRTVSFTIVVTSAAK